MQSWEMTLQLFKKMNFNSNRQNVDHLVSVVRSGKVEADKLQFDFNEKRMRRVEKAVATRPLFIPLNFGLNAAGKPSAYSKTTSPSNYDVIILGFVSSNSDREVSIRRPDSKGQSFAHVGEFTDLRLKLNEIAGVKNFAGDGQRGVFYLPSPIRLRPNDKLTIDVFKPDTTVTDEVLEIVLIGLRVYPQLFGESLLSASQQELMNINIDTQATPETRFLKHIVTFDANGIARNVRTPATDEPLLIRGVRSSLKNAKINVGLEDEQKWTTDPIPMWSFAEFADGDNYRWFERPVFLPKGAHLEMDFVNATGDDADAQDGTLTWICETA